jgi:hypothetical protein
MRMRMPIARLEMAKTMECRPQRSSSVGAMIVFEIEASKGLGDHPNNTLHRLFKFFVASAWVSICRLVETRVGQYCLAPCPTDSANRFVASHTNRCFAERC